MKLALLLSVLAPLMAFATASPVASTEDLKSIKELATQDNTAVQDSTIQEPTAIKEPGIDQAPSGRTKYEGTNLTMIQDTEVNTAGGIPNCNVNKCDSAYNSCIKNRCWILEFDCPKLCQVEVCQRNLREECKGCNWCWRPKDGSGSGNPT